MALRRRKARNPLFRKRWFSDDVIILAVRWYLRYKLSYRDLAGILAELGTSVAPCTRPRWVVRYTPDFVQYWRTFEKPVGRSWRCDETYIRVGGRWMYLYRAVDQWGRTVESHLSRTRDMSAAKAFFRKALAPATPGSIDHETLGSFGGRLWSLGRQNSRLGFGAIVPVAKRDFGCCV
jgi:transposase-like protein